MSNRGEFRGPEQLLFSFGSRLTPRARRERFVPVFVYRPPIRMRIRLGQRRAPRVHALFPRVRIFLPRGHTPLRSGRLFFPRGNALLPPAHLLLP